MDSFGEDDPDGAIAARQVLVDCIGDVIRAAVEIVPARIFELINVDEAYYRISIAGTAPHFFAMVDVAFPAGYRWHRAVEYRPTGRTPADTLQAAITGIKISPRHNG